MNKHRDTIIKPVNNMSFFNGVSILDDLTINYKSQIKYYMLDVDTTVTPNSSRPVYVLFDNQKPIMVIFNISSGYIGMDTYYKGTVYLNNDFIFDMNNRDMLGEFIQTELNCDISTMEIMIPGKNYDDYRIIKTKSYCLVIDGPVINE